MIRCENCGSELPANAQFCGSCGYIIRYDRELPTIATDISGTVIQTPNTPTPLPIQTSPEQPTQRSQGYEESMATFISSSSQLENMPTMTLGEEEKKDEDEEERKRRLLLGLPLLGAAAGGEGLVGGGGALFPGGITGGGQLGSNAPMVQGVAQGSSMPMVQGTPNMPGSIPTAPGIANTAPPPPSAFTPSAPPNPMPFTPPTAPVTPPPVQPPIVLPASGPPIAPPPVIPPVVPVATGGGILGTIPIVIIIPLIIIVIIAGSVGAIYVLLPAKLTLSTGTSVVSGIPLVLHGSNFVPGGTATLTLDDKPVKPASASISNGGTFDVTISETEDWSVGNHTLRASEGLGARSSTVDFKVARNDTKISPSITTFANPGDANCTYAVNQGWTCNATLGTDASAKGKIKWSATSSGIDGISISPTGGVLTPGQPQTVTLKIPDQFCPAQATFTFTFSGGEAPVNVPWNCAAAPVSWAGVSCPSNGSAYVCPFTVILPDGSQGKIHWSASSKDAGVTVDPQSGTLALGQSQAINVSFPVSVCQNPSWTGSWTVSISGGQSITGTLFCTTV